MMKKSKSSLEYALLSINDALRKYREKNHLGLSDAQIGQIFVEAKQDALAVDVQTVDDAVRLIEFTKKQQELLEAIRKLSKNKQ